MSQTPLFDFDIMPERRIWRVSEFTERVGELLEGEFPDVWIEGEVSNFKAAQSGHLYFTLKDARAQLRCVCFRDQARGLKFRPEDGLHITVRGSIGVYEMRGEYQLYVSHIEPVGLGALQLAFEQLKKKLEGEGLFEEVRKRPLPVLPRCIGVVTSPSGAAIRDILRVLKRRFANAHVQLYPVKVQGDGAALEIAGALRYFSRARVVDVVIVARGGGSLEDLWAFNEENVVRAIATCTIPVITGIGHETDFTIADFVADMRASTPSAAAELVVRSRQEFDRHLADLQHKLGQHMRIKLLEARHQLRELGVHRGLRQLEDQLRRHRQRTDELTAQLADGLRGRIDRVRRRLGTAATHLLSIDLRARFRTFALKLEQSSARLSTCMERSLVVKHQRLDRLRLQLEERSPLRVLERGYAICYDAAGNVIRAADEVPVGDLIRVQLSRGRLGAEVKDKE